jgi:transcriptional regulator with XRE-family HTH domain
MSAEKIGPWDSETIRRARKARNLTQAELAESLGCRQQTISEWELGMYAPKNAYQKLLSMFFGSAPVVAENIPSQAAWSNDAAAAPAASDMPFAAVEKN